MPLYNYECDSCKHRETDVFASDPTPAPICPNCGVAMDRDYASTSGLQGPDVWSRGGITLEHVAEKPMHFSSKTQLKEFCRKNGFSSGALL